MQHARHTCVPYGWPFDTTGRRTNVSLQADVRNWCACRTCGVGHRGPSGVGSCLVARRLGCWGLCAARGNCSGAGVRAAARILRASAGCLCASGIWLSRSGSGLDPTALARTVLGARPLVLRLMAEARFPTCFCNRMEQVTLVRSSSAGSRDTKRVECRPRFGVGPYAQTVSNTRAQSSIMVSQPGVICTTTSS